VLRRPGSSNPGHGPIAGQCHRRHRHQRRDGRQNAQDARVPQTRPKPARARLRQERQGKPVAGAKIWSPTSAFGGFRTSANSTSDANGYYEVLMQHGVGRVWIAGVGMTYNGVRIALPLHPADGEISDFHSKTGGVENLALFTYGIANEAGVNDNPGYGGNYYGASFRLMYYWREPGDESAPRERLILESEMEVTLTPTARSPTAARAALSSSARK
jgi:hypothetical protein